MMTLLAVAGAIVAFAAGWALHRSRDPLVEHAGETAVAGVPGVLEVIGHHPTGVVLADAVGVVQFRNDAARSLAGTHVGVLVEEAIERHLRRARQGPDEAEVLELYGPPKTVVVVQARALDSGWTIAFVEDISDQRRIDQIRTDFVANISHELKTPIGALSVLAETLVDEDDPATIRRVAERMMEEARRAGRTVDDLMELSRIELGGERSVEPVAVADVIRGALDRVTELTSQRDITITADGPAAGGDACPDGFVLEGDRRQLVSAVGNLVENAVKYSAPGGSVDVLTRCDAGHVEISVADRGVGIPQRDLDRIFERFYRVDRARSRFTGGTGLGLSIVRHVATNHGGEVVVTSTEGQGSTFVLRLPVRPSAGAPDHTHSEGIA